MMTKLGQFGDNVKFSSSLQLCIFVQ